LLDISNNSMHITLGSLLLCRHCSMTVFSYNHKQSIILLFNNTEKCIMFPYPFNVIEENRNS
jgi:hypothetical protein